MPLSRTNSQARSRKAGFEVLRFLPFSDFFQILRKKSENRKIGFKVVALEKFSSFRKIRLSYWSEIGKSSFYIESPYYHKHFNWG